MVLALAPESPPIQVDENGVLRVGGTRVTLDTVVYAFNAGATPEEIVDRFDTLHLDDVYLVVGFYLRHRGEVDAYLSERQRRGDQRRAEADAILSWSELRKRLEARRGAAKDASPGGG
jgi:uncharacterized protein (DUF433 family)